MYFRSFLGSLILCSALSSAPQTGRAADPPPFDLVIS